MATPERPKRILYGFSKVHDSLCFFDEERVRALSAEVSAVKACSTVGAAMELGESLTLTWVPDAPEDLEEMEAQGLEPGDSYVWSETGSVADGDWPPMPTALSLDVFAKDDLEARKLIFDEPVRAVIVDTTLNGEYLEIPADREQALVAAFDRLGIPHTRDDSVVMNLDGNV